ncbi:hypothetical protein SK571_40070 [Lentzea sp. BCCO 10_0798]|uniref:Zinc-finger n=1 Tax=Lentzea kristufekii TaxID=3095430 RepID=A0ABU4U4V4_9PSEU|nr:hypothetical protein [Lentzea sp. BCCO 10_0798]MDX8055610.1 hypothetical protein [Lentzea sp. BCCO 10_0798]
MTDACPHALSAGSYLLGLLTAEETQEFRQHSTRCSHCQGELVDLMPGALYLQELRADILAAGRRPCTDRPFLSTVVAREPRWIAGCGTY